MFFIPFNTDAPIYHWPLATVGLILVNVLVFAAALVGEGDFSGWMLIYGDGLHPLQWVSSIFLHAGFLHLFGNMVFLWTFGLVVEGKLGWWKFLLVYLGIGVGQSAIEQIMMLGYDWSSSGPGGSLGASAAIFGIEAIALVWAPKNEMDCFYGYWILFAAGFGTVEVSILTLAGMYVALEAFFFCLSLYLLGGVAIGSAALHLMGALLGFAVGVFMLKTKMVDCEDWDLFAVWKGKEGRLARTEREAKLDEKVAAKKQSAAQTEREKSAELIHFFLKNNNVDKAFSIFTKYNDPPGTFELPKNLLLVMTRQLHEASRWSDSTAVMSALLKQHPDGAERVQLKLAQILLQHEHRPQKALELLECLPGDLLPEGLEKARQGLIAQANTALEEGELELDEPI
jgi:membrane associated rhomboid family serine protease